MAVITEGVLQVIITDSTAEKVKKEFNGGKVPVGAIIVALDVVLEKLQQSPEQQEDRSNIN